METTTHTNRVVVSLLLLGFTLMALPLSVFSQEETPAIAVENNEIVFEENRLKHSYTIDKLTGGEDANDFVVGPGKVELSLEPGESKTIELTVSNRMGEAKKFKFEIEDITGSDDPTEAVVLLGDDRGPYTLKDYIDIPDIEFELGHMERARIPITVSLPADAEVGGRYGSVLVSAVSKKASGNDSTATAPSSAIITRIGTLFFVTTPGSTDVSGELVSFQSIPDKKTFSKGPINFGLVYENTGSVHLNPYGEVSITNMSGDEVGFIELDSWFALPKSLRTREISWNREFLIGKYTATAKINRGYDDIIDETSVTFWVLPWKFIVIVITGLFVFFLGIRFIFRSFEIRRK